MFFGLFKRSEDNNNLGLPKHLIEFLELADKEYMRAFALKTTRGLQPYVTRECAVEVSQAVFSIGSRYFGADKFRKTTWSYAGEEDSITLARKDVVFDRIKIGGDMRIGVADNYSEIWEVDLSDKKSPVISGIHSCKD